MTASVAALRELAQDAALDYERLISAAQRGDVAALAHMLASHGPALVADIKDARRNSRLQSLPANVLPEVVRRDAEILTLTAKCDRQADRIRKLEEKCRQAGSVRKSNLSIAKVRAELHHRHGVEIRKLRAMLHSAQAKLDEYSDVIAAKNRSLRMLVATKITANRKAIQERPADRKRARLRRLLGIAPE
jgi:hypothetical protein